MVDGEGLKARQAKIDGLLKTALGNPIRPKGTAIIYTPTRKSAEDEAQKSSVEQGGVRGLTTLASARMSENGYRRPFVRGTSISLRQPVRLVWVSIDLMSEP